MRKLVFFSPSGYIPFPVTSVRITVEKNLAFFYSADRLKLNYRNRYLFENFPKGQGEESYETKLSESGCFVSVNKERR